MNFKGIFFDLDGTLVDSRLDFDSMRADLDFPPGAPILEEIEGLEDEIRQQHCLEVVHQHELKGAQDSTLIAGVSKVLDLIKDRSVPTGILTRNSKICAELMVKKHGIGIEHVLTREDCTPKPDPAGLIRLADIHGLDCRDCLYVGDYLFDIETARNAGMKSALYTNGKGAGFENEADFSFHHYDQFLFQILYSR